MNITVEHPKEEQIIIYLRKGFFESNSKFEYRVQKALFGEITIITQKLEFILTVQLQFIL